MIIDELISIFVGTKHDRDIKRLVPIVKKINSFEETMADLPADEFHAKTAQFRDRITRGEKLDSILPEAYALVREAAGRKLGLRPFDVQLMGGIVLHQGKIAEMKTGEGKTLAAVLPVYLNALAGKGVHVITVNDYLARRDAEWMGPVYEALGIRAGVIQQDMDDASRRLAYGCDVTYGTNSEFGFDYLRDNMVDDPGRRVQRGFHYAIVDEVDSILIDEARTPLIISGPSEGHTRIYKDVDRLISRLNEGADYAVSRKDRTALLTEAGLGKIEHMLNVRNLYDVANIEYVHYVDQALKAHALYKRDVDYIVQDGEVVIVDEFTGRVLPGRRYSDGLHQAIEAKENVVVQRENQTYATVTIQNYFRMYAKLAGMTGTADTEAVEFKKTYKLDVVVIPTNEPMIRTDDADRVYSSEEEKFTAVADEIEDLYRSNRPVLAGTVSIEKSEKLSYMLRRRGIPHQVLNAKHHEQEARIIAEAGKAGAVTIATNMAGRGVDIVLGGKKSYIDDMASYAAVNGDLWNAFREKVFRDDFKGAAEISESGAGQDKNVSQTILRKWREWNDNHQKVVGLGGLHIIGTERHEARRIDNQLRGRSGRQGDPGSSRFYVSLEDDLVAAYATGPLSGMPKHYEVYEGGRIADRYVSRAIEKAQQRIELQNFMTRKHLLEYDDVMNIQRDYIYRERNRILDGGDLSQAIIGYIHEICREKINSEFAHNSEQGSSCDAITGWLKSSFSIDIDQEGFSLDNYLQKELPSSIAGLLIRHYNEKTATVGADTMRMIERLISLQEIDARWRELLLLLDELRDGIWTLSYGERNPVNEYKIRGFQLFNESISRMKNDIVGFILTASDKVSGSIVTEYGDSILPAPPAEADMPDMHSPQRQKYKAIISVGGVKRKKTRRSRRSV